jgi:hypothetical protein
VDERRSGNTGREGAVGQLQFRGCFLE